MKVVSNVGMKEWYLSILYVQDVKQDAKKRMEKKIWFLAFELEKFLQRIGCLWRAVSSCKR